MTFQGHIENGTVVLDEPAQLPDGTKVVVEVQMVTHSIEIDPEVRRFSGILPKGLDYRRLYYDALAAKHQ